MICLNNTAEPAKEKKKNNRKNRKKGLLLIILLLEAALIAALIFAFQVTTVEKRFIRAMRHGITAGWSKENNEIQLRDDALPNDTSFIDLEYDAVKVFGERSFRNKELGKLAHEYVDSLKECRDVMNEYDPDKDYDAFWSNFSQSYGRRIAAIYAIYNGEYGLNLDDEQFKEERDEILLYGWSLKKTESMELSRSSSSGSSEESSDEGGNTNDVFTATAKNDSGFDLEYINIDVELYDKDGNKIETVAAYAEDIKNGEDFELKCYQTNNTHAESYMISSVSCERKRKAEEQQDEPEAAEDKTDAEAASAEEKAEADT